MEGRQSERVIWVNGTFDVMHVGHIKLLEYAKSLGDHLIVGIDRDSRVKEKKGPTRPINSCDMRMIFLKSISFVDKVVSFGSDDELRDWIRVLKPAIMVVGVEYQDKEVIGSEFAGEVKFFDRFGDYSTTKIISNS